MLTTIMMTAVLGQSPRDAKLESTLLADRVLGEVLRIHYDEARAGGLGDERARARVRGEHAAELVEAYRDSRPPLSRATAEGIAGRVLAKALVGHPVPPDPKPRPRRRGRTMH